MFAEGIFPIGDGLLDIDEERLKDLLVPHDINEIYEVEQTPFARGKFAAVRRAIHKNSGTHFAAKFLKRRRRAQSSDKEIKHEIAVLMLCNDADNIVKLNAVHESRSDTALLLELATGGELQTFLDNEECLSEAQARICMRQVLKALQFLHKRSIVHLDLKPQNILLAGERIEDGLKLCDFGISRVVAEGTNVREIVGTPDYVAPEVLQYEPLSLLTDIWSVGVLAYVLLSGFSPFGGETKQETFLNISQCALTFPDKLFGGVSSAAIDFIRKALRIKPNDRMTAAGCLEHIWLKDECNIDRHIFNAITNKQQLEHDDDDHDAEDDVDDDEEDDADVDVDDEDHIVNADVANNVENAEDNDQQNEEVKDTTTTNTIADDDDEVQIIKDKLPQAISVDNSEEEDNNTSNNSFTKTVNKPFSKSTNTNINNTTTHHHHNNHQQPHHSSSNGGLTNGHLKSHSNNSLTNGHSSNGLANGHHHHDYTTTNGYANGHMSVATKGSGHHSMYNSYTKLREELNDKSAKLSLVRPSMSATTTKTTAVHNVTATSKAVTIPLCSVQPQLQMQQQTLTTTTPQEQQQQQLLHIPARRHSSESNKENTFLTTKKITANNISNGSNSSSQATLKKTSTSTNSSSFSSSSSSTTSLSTIPNTQSATATATIHITPNPTLNTSNIVATITLPTAASVSVVNGVNISSDKTVVNTATANNHHSLFPDAPTTPKVIRKAPTTDASPTSVKALVKKFQLEGGDQTITPPEFATNGSKHNHQQHQQQQQQHQLHNQSQTKYNNVRSTLSPPTLAHSSAITIMNSSRRASEPITAIHMNNNNNNNNNSNKKITSTSAPVSIPASAANNFKTTCVYCVSCTNSLTNGCRHPNSSTNNISTSLASTTTKYSSNTHSNSSSSSTKSLNNAVGSNATSNNTAVGGNTTANSSNGSSSSQALLFGQHTQHLMNSSHQQQQQQHLNNHHHHHHHTHHHLHHHGVVVKNANASANGLSLDQGIIC